MLPETLEIASLYEQAQLLSSYEPGQGYDTIGTRLSEIVRSPRSVLESERILSELEKNKPGAIQAVQEISTNSEMMLEIFFGERILEKNAETPLIDSIMDTYPYDWYKKRSLLESSLIEQGITNPNLLIIGVSGMPHTGLSLNQLRNFNIIWLDPYPNTLALGRKIIRRLQQDAVECAQNILIHPYNEATFSEDLDVIAADIKFDLALLTDTRHINRNLCRQLHQRGINNIGCSLNHGLCQLLYKNPDPNDISPYYIFEKGFYPENIIDLKMSNWISSNALSYGSLGIFNRVDEISYHKSAIVI